MSARLGAVPLEHRDQVTERGDDAGIDSQDHEGRDEVAQRADQVISLWDALEDPEVNVGSDELGVDDD